MKIDEKTTRTLMLLILFGVALNAAIQNLSAVGRAVDVVLGILSPLLLGLVLAFLLTILVNLLEKRLIKPRGKRALALQARFRRPMSILLSVAIVLAVLVAFSAIILPRMMEALALLFTQLPGLVEGVRDQVIRFVDEQPEMVAWVESLSIDWAGIQAGVLSFFRQGLGTALDSVISVATSVFGTATSVALTFIIALSVTAQKEKLAGQMRILVRTFFRKPVAERIIQITRQTSRAFSGFITAQVLEACILGALVFLGMSVFRFPQALLISAMVAVTGIIPIFGAFFSAAVGALLILATSGVAQAFWFVVFFVVLQQLEGNLIYPRVMGSNVDLPALWVLVAITVGGGAMGILGMLMFVPIFAVGYHLLRDAVRARRKNRQKGMSENAADS